MAVGSQGYSAEILYQVGEEVLGTTFYFRVTSGYSGTQGAEELAKALVTAVDDILEALGNTVKLHAVKVKGLADEPKWTYVAHVEKVGTAATEAVSDLVHLRLNIISETIQDAVKRNSNQIAGIPNGDLTDGRVSNDVTTAWLNALDNWAQGSIQGGGFQFFLCVGWRQNNQWFFADAEQFRVSPFAGSRIDRILNRPNTGKKKAVDNGGGPQPPVDP